VTGESRSLTGLDLPGLDLPGGWIVAGRDAKAACMIAAIRTIGAEPGAGIVLLVEPAMPQPERAMLIAAIAPLAIELGPASRLSLIDLRERYDAADALAAARFLADAGSTTGQVLAVG
jgi:hypothetical protein